MTGPEHYAESERLILSCELTAADDRNPAVYPGLEDSVDSTTHALMAAQVHATLALAAAMAMGWVDGEDFGNGPEHFFGWQR